MFTVQTVACAEIRGVSASAVLGHGSGARRPSTTGVLVQAMQKSVEFPQVPFLDTVVACPLLCMPEVMVCSSDVEQIVASCHRSWGNRVGDTDCAMWCRSWPCATDHGETVKVLRDVEQIVALCH